MKYLNVFQEVQEWPSSSFPFADGDLDPDTMTVHQLRSFLKQNKAYVPDGAKRGELLLLSKNVKATGMSYTVNARVRARYGENDEIYNATIVKLDTLKKRYKVAWEDGDETDLWKSDKDLRPNLDAKLTRELVLSTEESESDDIVVLTPPKPRIKKKPPVVVLSTDSEDDVPKPAVK